MPILDYSDVSERPLIAGQLATTERHKARTKFNRSNGILPFGLAVVQGDGDMDAIAPTASDTDFVGITLESRALERRVGFSETTTGLMGYPEDYEMGVVNECAGIGVHLETNVAPGDDVYFRHSATGVQVAGAFRNDTDGGSATLIPGARFIRSGLAGGIGRLAIDEA